MESSHYCTSCQAPLQPDDGHDLCPACLGPEHLREALEGNPCMNCGYMSRAARLARLAEVEPPQVDADIPPSGQEATSRPGRSKRRANPGAADAAPPSKRKSKADRAQLSSRVEQLSAELSHMRAMLLARQPESPSEEARVPTPQMPHLAPEEDTLSLAASATHFREYEEVVGDTTSQASDQGSRSSALTSLSEDEGSMRAVLWTALEKLNLDIPQQAESAPASAFFRRRPASTAFAVPHAEDYLKELQACWGDSKALSRLSADGRMLAAMHDAAGVGLDHMPPIEPVIASLVVSPDEALRREARCPRPQCRLTDDLLVRGYDAGARAGRIGNSLSHLLLALSASLQEGKETEDSIPFCDASLEAFGLMSRELGRMMSIPVQARRQVWLSQSGLTDTSRRTLQALPVVPGTVFGPAAQEALDRTIQAGQTRQQLLSLRRAPPSSRGRGSFATPVARPPPEHTRAQRPQRPTQRQTWDSRDSGRSPPGQFQAPDPGRPPTPRAPRGRGARR